MTHRQIVNEILQHARDLVDHHNMTTDEAATFFATLADETDAEARAYAYEAGLDGVEIPLLAE